MSNPIGRVLKRRSLRANVQRALESGVGLYHTTWRIEAERERHVDAELAAELLDWCRDTVGLMHRPYGLDHVSLTIAVLNDEGEPVSTTNFGVLRPQDFYDHGPAELQVRETFRRWRAGRLFARNQDGRLSATLFSWGDLTRELLLAG